MRINQSELAFLKRLFSQFPGLYLYFDHHFEIKQKPSLLPVFRPGGEVSFPLVFEITEKDLNAIDKIVYYAFDWTLWRKRDGGDH
ncbi:MAG: hypothetical protein DRJ47_10530 [Thermoprotei archaeon]|nr:MAG: hypothetical protein DRJ47_10530 [Thermoprotei archaeon]